MNAKVVFVLAVIGVVYANKQGSRVRRERDNMAANSLPQDSGVPIDQIRGPVDQWDAHFSAVFPSVHHTVLYHIHRNGSIHPGYTPYEAPEKDKWDKDHVRMPFSDHNTYIVQGENVLKKRWKLIKKALTRPIPNVHKLTETILSYNQEYKGEWRFPALKTQFEEIMTSEENQYFFENTLPKIVELALRLPDLIKAPIPLLKKGQNKSVSLSQLQVASLLANSFLCTFPLRNSRRNTRKYPNINFSKLYESKGIPDIMAKLKCILNYFFRVCNKAPQGVVTFTRRYVPQEFCPDWGKSPVPMSRLYLHVDSTGSLSDTDGLIHMDFANKYIGGGVIGHGSVQEEIMFITRTEMLVSKLFCEKMDDNEAIMIIGCESYNQHTGYSREFRWAGDFEDKTERDSSGRRRTAAIAIDAIPYNEESESKQGNLHMMERELNKAWVGVSFFSNNDNRVHFPGVATGNWGCGAFLGSKPLKSLIQMMAFAQANRPMAFFTFQDSELMANILNTHRMLSERNTTVGDVYQHLSDFIKLNYPLAQLHETLKLMTNKVVIEKPKGIPDRFGANGNQHTKTPRVGKVPLSASSGENPSIKSYSTDTGAPSEGDTDPTVSAKPESG